LISQLPRRIFGRGWWRVGDDVEERSEIVLKFAGLVIAYLATSGNSRTLMQLPATSTAPHLPLKDVNLSRSPQSSFTSCLVLRGALYAILS
jgi:hypothetical protein